MRTIFFLVTLPFLILHCGRPALTNDSISILTYNVKNCTGMDGVTDYNRIAGVIRKTDADFTAIQELDSITTRSKGVFVLDTLAKLSGMNGIFSASISYQGGKYGIGILSKEKPLSWKRIPLPGREEKRSLLVVEYSHLIMACTHLSLTADDRLQSVKIINDVLKDQTKPVFLAGDLNAVPSSAVIKNLCTDWKILNDTSMFTIPSGNPARCIDYIMGLKTDRFEMTTRRAIVINEPVASDHRPVNVLVGISLK